MIIADLVQDQSTLAHLEARNDSRNGNGLVYLRRPARKIVAYVKNIIQFYFNPRQCKRCDSSSKPRWCAPPEGGVCMNVDAPSSYLGP
jgi:hypothetical protein